MTQLKSTQAAPGNAFGSTDSGESRLEKQAAWHLERASSSDISLEEHDYHLGQVKLLAELLCDKPATRPTGLNLIGRVALDQGQWMTAQQALDKAVQLAPADAGIRYSLGHLALQRQQVTEAATQFRTAMELNPNATIADQALAYVKFRSGLFAEAFSDYRRLIRKYPDQWPLKTRLLECASRIQADYDDAALSQDVVDLLATDDLDHQNLASLAGSLLIHRYRLTDPASQIELQQLISDDLLCNALTRLLFIHPELDELLATLRQTLFHHFLSTGQIDDSLTPLLTGLVWHGWHSEYVLAETPEEAATVDSLIEHCETLLTEQAWADLALPISLLALYRPLHDTLSTPANEALRSGLATLEPHLPSELMSALSQQLLDISAEQQRAAALPALTPVHELTSQAVRQQYEENPYPRWKFLPRYSATPYLKAVASEIPAYQLSARHGQGRLNMLVAGTGTGRHAIHLARHFYDTRVTAIDLSRRSLAYADGMAESFGLNNIQFLQADILELPEASQGSYDVIECSGVLHHMADPMAGWQKLTAQLRSGGLMKIGLYSTRARRVIHRLRQVINEQGLQATPADIRRFRHSLLQPPLADDLGPLVQSVDFYSMSGVRDLLFHVQEHTFTPAELAEMIDQLPLTFLGFVLTPAARRSYQHFFPADPLMNNLDNWDRLEQDNPNLFTGMYQMYLQKD